ncbi:S46 family peptidase [Terricaulis silvestris]|uniref:Dipeptidyl-peptidase n=1 Tax=Terricaulis silvestris TaxID=2686094 RepID=A0A6I6MMA9_9CAUL|nr:S46 family peptidase [Terricaulis silvestris]QGZ94104.1 Peptidase S46 [Terricaulis silvestris]
MRNPLRAAAAAACVFALIATPASSEEGMWTFDNFPAARMQRDLGWAPDQAWLDRVMAGAARLPGCSGSNVSANGLMLTNHHCITACLRNLSSEQSDFLAAGFTARTREEERRCPNYSISILTGITDVTQRIDTATAGVAADAFARTRDAEIARIESECTSGQIRCEVTTLYQGGRYALYNYKRYDDVRMVFAPEQQVAAFGGDPDNYNFPRYCLDFAILRVYENGAPAATPAHLSMRFTPVTEDEVVLAVGNPGTTSRSRTTAEMAFQRDIQLPWMLNVLSETRGRLIAYSELGPNQRRLGTNALQGVENLVKRFSGQRMSLVSAENFARVTAAEQDFQARVRRNSASAREVGDAWGEISRAQDTYRGMFYRHQMLEASAAQRSQLFGWARDLVRAAEERPKPDAQRMPRYTDARISVVERSITGAQPTETDFERLNLEIWLLKLREYLTVDDPTVQRILNRQSPEELAARLSQSRLGDPAVRRQLWEGGGAAIAASDDPMIVFVRSWDTDARQVREQFETQVEGPVARAHERIARARFRAFGTNTYPDATGTPRITYGRVRGWTEGTRTVPWFTNIDGLYARATNAEPFNLSQRWIDARGRVNGATVYNIATTTESVGGASGSPLLDREGRVVGASFDGNIHATAGTFFYDPTLNRTVTVTTTAMQAALRDVYGMNALLAELGGS